MICMKDSGLPLLKGSMHYRWMAGDSIVMMLRLKYGWMYMAIPGLI